MTITLTTTSAHKAGEIAAMLGDVPGLSLRTLAEFAATEAPVEDRDSMAGNARLKAEFYATHCGTLVLADDSGLEVDALDGAPGVHSARWAEGTDQERVVALLERLEGMPEESRTARYRCALCLADASGVRFETEATCEGAIALAPRGTGGFGYDPIFQITLATGADAVWVGRTLGEAPPAVKAEISHRARAVQELRSWLLETHAPDATR